MPSVASTAIASRKRPARSGPRPFRASSNVLVCALDLLDVVRDDRPLLDDLGFARVEDFERVGARPREFFALLLVERDPDRDFEEDEDFVATVVATLLHRSNDGDDDRSASRGGRNVAPNSTSTGPFYIANVA